MKYKKYKDFIPEEYYNNYIDMEKERHRSLFKIILLLNILLLPITFNSFDNNGESTESIISVHGEIINENYYGEIMLLIGKTHLWEEGDFSNVEKSIVMKGLNNVKKLENEEKIYINRIETLGKDKYRVEIRVE